MEEKATEIVQQMIKTVKAFQMYGKEHPALKNFSVPFYQNLASFLREYSEFSFKIDRFAILFNDKVIYDESDKDSSIAFRLFRDGIRNFTFLEGLTEDESIHFAEVISQPMKNQDITLTLWESDFAHITFYVVEEDEDVMTYRLPDTPAMDINYDEHLDNILKQEKLDMTLPLNPILTETELESFKQEISEEDGRSQLPKAISVLIDFLNVEKSEEIVNSLVGVLDLCINNHDFYDARRIVHKLQAFPDIKPLEKFETEAGVMTLSSLPDILSDANFNEFLAFIGFFSSKTAPYFVQLVGKTKKKERVEALRQRVSYICQGDPSPLIDFLYTTDIAAIVNVVAILGIMKRKETLRHLQLLVNHPDARVRTALAYAYNDFGELKKSSSFLNDSDQDVRIKVLQLFTIRPYARIYSELLRKIKAKQFQLLDYNEQKEFISCLVANGDAKLLKSLERMLFKRKIFGAKNYRNMRRLAALGLSQIGTDEAMKILENGLNKKNKDIKMACEMVTKSR